jgi:hypothetical protein
LDGFGKSEKEGGKGMKAIGVYAFRNVRNGKWYVGQSRDMVRRRSIHMGELRNKQHKNSKWQVDFNRVGLEGFEYFVLSELPGYLFGQEMGNWLDAVEILWIKVVNSYEAGYNQTIGGAGTVPDPFAKTVKASGLWRRPKRLTGKAYWRSLNRGVSETRQLVFDRFRDRYLSVSGSHVG